MAERQEGKPIASPDDTLTVALSLAKAGWPVFPVKLIPVVRADGTKAVDKRPTVKWLEGATTDLEQIATWWGSEFPGAWVGVHAARAGIVVVDLDVAKGDRPDGAAELKREGYELPKSFRYKTRSGGRHYVYAAPEGKRLTIARDHPVKGVDIRAGHGLMVYYGPVLTEAPALAAAPSWSVLELETTKGKGAERGADGDIEHWLSRTTPGKPTKALRELLADVEPNDLDHDTMLTVVTGLVKLAGERGAQTAYLETRAGYLEGRPDRARDWDNATRGSIGQLGTPPATLELSKAERQLIKERNKPKAIAAAEQQRKNDYRVAKHAERSADAGARVLEDGPLAVELAEAMLDRWAYTETMGLLKYDGKRWESAEPHALVEEVRNRLDAIEVDEHAAAVYRGDNKGIDKARTLLSRNRARAVSDLVIGRLALRKTKPDAHPHLLNTPTGIVDLRTRELLPHDPELMLTKMTAVGYDPKADMTLWRKALEALPAKAADYLQVRMGQAATGHTPDDDVLVLLEGAGENGKTTVLSAPRAALGDYAVTVPDRLLMANPGDHPTELTTLMGARWAAVEELPEGRNLNVKRLKDVVGTPWMTARRMRQDNVSWQATHCLFLSTNYLPVVAETDHGTWRRLLLVRFPYRFVKARGDIKSDRDRMGDVTIKRRLEGYPDAGVLRWLVDGAAAWYANGERMPAPPKRIVKDTEAWRLDADPVLAYVAERIELDPTRAIATTDLADDFNDYIERRGHRPWSAQTINARFDGHVSMAGIERKRVRFGLRMVPSRTGFNAKGLPPNTQAWAGIRFKADEGTTVTSEAERDAAALADLERRMHR